MAAVSGGIRPLADLLASEVLFIPLLRSFVTATRRAQFKYNTQIQGKLE